MGTQIHKVHAHTSALAEENLYVYNHACNCGCLEDYVDTVRCFLRNRPLYRQDLPSADLAHSSLVGLKSTREETISCDHNP